jgi:ketosteroid isomerase-like protein
MNQAEQRGCDLVRAFFSALSDGDLEGLRMLLHADAS